MADPRISPQAAHDLMRDEGYVYIDVRSPEEFALGHPKGARNVPWLDNPDFLGTLQREFAEDAKLIVGCRTNNRSAKAAAALRGAGFRDVLEQRAGMAGLRDAFGGVIERGWEDAGLPVSRT
ncbi:MAG TPA: rhodanese-like domain-containing protein [Polyangiales bacterium]|nr:rhodanese-like domain-containing protein [Polyangiales bacterium]